MEKPSDQRCFGDVMKWSDRCQEHFFPWRSKSSGDGKGARIAEAGITEAWPGYELERSAPRYHLLVYPIEGSGNVCTAKQTCTVSREQVLIVPAGTPFGYRPLRSRWHFLWFHLGMDDGWQPVHLNRVVVRKTAQTGPLGRLMEDFLRESRGRGPTAEKAAALYSELILLYIRRELGQYEEETDTGFQTLLQHIWHKVNRDLKRAWTVESLADEMGMSTSHFHRLVRETQRVSPMKMVTRLRMERAQELLIMHDVPINVISEQVGYHNPYAFAVAFKRFSGVTPGEFRKRR